MSHPNNTKSDRKILHVVEFSPQNYAVLKRSKNLWATLLIASMLAWLVAMATLLIASLMNLSEALGMTLFVALIAVSVFIVPLVVIVVIAADIRRKYRKVAADRTHVRDANAVARGYQHNVRQLRGAKFTVISQDGPSPENLSLPFTLKVIMHDRPELQHEYRIAGTRVDTLSGPELSKILPQLSKLLLRDHFGESASHIEASFPESYDTAALASRQRVDTGLQSE
jgi:uncharacterized membrane protein YhdT